MQYLYMNNDNVIELPKLINGKDATHIPNAVITLTLKDLSGTTLLGPTAVDYVPGSDSLYQVIAPYTLALTNKQKIVAFIVADGAGLRGDWEKTLTVIKRT